MAEVPHLNLAGVLEKRAHSFPYNWKRRYVVLQGEDVVYYAPNAAGLPAEENPRRVLRQISLVAPVDGKRRFRVVSDSNSVVTHFRASTPVQCAEWINGLQRLLVARRQQMYAENVGARLVGGPPAPAAPQTNAPPTPAIQSIWPRRKALKDYFATDTDFLPNTRVASIANAHTTSELVEVSYAV